MSAPRLHPFWRLFLCALAVLLITSVVVAVGTKVALGLMPVSEIQNLSPRELGARLTRNFGLWLTVLAYPPALLVIYGFRLKVDKRSWSSLGFVRAGALSNFVRGALAGLLTLTVLFSLLWLVGVVQFGGWSSDVLTRGWLYSVAALGAYFVAFLLVGLMEETAFRGYGLHNLNSWLGWRGAVAVQAIVFALIHVGNVGATPDPNALRAAVAALPNLALIAVFFALAYRKTGSLWFPIGFHAAWNFCLGCVFSQPVSAIATFRLFDVRQSGTSFLSGGAFGAEGSFFLIPLVLAMIVCLSLAPDHPRALANLNAPESPQAADSVPAAPIPAPIVLVEEPEEARENRYNSRFGSAQGFDSDTLRELKQMQDARDEAQRQRDDAIRAARREEELRLEEVRRAQIAAQEQVAAVENEAPIAVATEIEVPASAEPSATEVPVAVAVEQRAEVTKTETKPIEPQIEVPKPARPSLEPRRPALEPRKPVVPPVVVTPEKSEASPTSTPPTEAPPKKARPRW